MKNYILIGFLLLSFTAHSQGVELNIPSNASMVFEINSPALIKAAPYEELEKSDFGKEMIFKLSKLFQQNVKSFNEIGILTSESSYIFLDQSTDQPTLVFLFPIKDKDLVERAIIFNRYNIEEADGYHFSSGPGGQSFYWNDKLLTIVQHLNKNSQVVPTQNYLSKATKSISSNPSYKKQKDENATFSFWIGDMSSALPKLTGALGNMSNELNDKMMSSLYEGYESLSMKMYLNKNESRLATEMSFNESVSSAYRNISKQKYNAEFFEYVDLKNCLGYFSSNINVKSLLTEYPAILNNQLEALPESNKYKSEIDLGMVLFSTLLDEEAVGDIIKGDMLFVLSDISEKEVEYTDYEYDSTYQRKEVTKTKIERVPDFIYMASLKDGKLSKATISYLLNKQLIEKQGSYYKIVPNKSVPVDLFMMIKNDILFIGTSVDRFRAISAGKYKAQVPSKFKDHINDNQVAFYAGVSKAEASLSVSDFPNKKRFAQFKNLFKDSPDVFFTAEKFKKNSAKGSVVIKTPKGHTSGLTYLLHLIEELK